LALRLERFAANLQVVGLNPTQHCLYDIGHLHHSLSGGVTNSEAEQLKSVELLKLEMDHLLEGCKSVLKTAPPI